MPRRVPPLQAQKNLGRLKQQKEAVKYLQAENAAMLKFVQAHKTELNAADEGQYDDELEQCNAGEVSRREEEEDEVKTPTNFDAEISTLLKEQVEQEFELRTAGPTGVDVEDQFFDRIEADLDGERDANKKGLEPQEAVEFLEVSRSFSSAKPAVTLRQHSIQTPPISKEEHRRASRV
ncbi:hypothetical protein LTR37_018412 [Vermiconidia calcicola]|uniref:Uncharacterized protein n=1 Tax=Vermiconidia calcicola TaxID=1690605 RepID=A0ACC3MH19_9PEZI|nr:hypothetical protein LTR37_018412 [Vermiconidia calcicola]